MLNIKKIRPIFNGVLITADIYKEDVFSTTGLVTIEKGSLKEYQKVIAVGSMVKETKVGDIIKLNPNRFKQISNQGSLRQDVSSVKEYYVFPIVLIDGKDHMYIRDNDIEFIIEEYEEKEYKPQFMKENNNIIL